MRKFFRKFSILQKLWILSGTIVLTVVLYFYLYFIHTTKAQFQEGLLKKGNGLVQTVSFNLGPGLYFNQPVFINRVLKGMENDPDVAFLQVVNKNGERIYGFKDNKFAPLIGNFIKKNRIRLLQDNYIFLKQSIFFNDEYQGDLIACFSMEWVNDKIAEQQKKVLLIIVILIIFLFLLTQFISKAISEPIQDVVKKLNNYTRGDFSSDIRLSEEGYDEIAQLSAAFNSLADSLEKNLKELDQSNKYIEAFFRFSPLPLLITDPSGNIRFANNSALNFLEIKMENLLESNVGVFLGASNFNTILNRINQGESLINDFITVLKSPESPQKIVEVNLSVLLDGEGNRKNFIFAFVDMTEKINTQRAILDNQTKLHKANWELLQKTSQLEKAVNKNKRNAKKLSRLIEIGQEIVRSISTEDIFGILVKSGKSLIEAERCLLFLWDPGKKILAPLRSNPAALSANASPLKPEDENVVCRAFSENQPFFLTGDSLQAADYDALGIPPNKILDILSVPLSEKDYKFGVAVYFNLQAKQFDLADLHLITTLAHLSAITLDKIYLLQALKEKAQHLEKAFTELKKSQDQVFQLQKMESLGTLVGGIAHDFNNILGIITPNADLIRMSAKSESDVLKRISIIQEAAERAADLTRQLLMFSRNQDVIPEPLDPRRLVKRLSGMLSRTLGKHIVVETEFDAMIPNIRADETRLTQVIINLAVNARDAMEGGGILTLGVSYRSMAGFRKEDKKKYVCIYVKDTGTGIPEKILPKIYDPFFTTKGVGNGTGLGLSVVYGIVKSHNAHIFVKTKPGRGTAFFIFFEPVGDAEKVKPQPPINYFPSGKNENILVVDDESMIRESLNDILKSLGYNTFLASSGNEALRILEKYPHIHLAIVDFIMPGMNGLATSKALKKLSPKLKVLLSSGQADRDGLLNGSSQIDGFLMKPYHISELELKLHQLLKNSLISSN